MDDFIEITRELIENNQELILCMGITITSQQALLTRINKYKWFRGLYQLSNRTKEECYRVMDVVMRHNKKSVFAIRRVEYEGKFKSIMYEVCDDMGI